MQKWIRSFAGLWSLICIYIVVFMVLIMNINASTDQTSPALIPILFLFIVFGALISTLREQNLRLKKIEEELAQLKRSQDN